MTTVVVQLVAASPLLLRELPAVHAAVCQLLSSGDSAGCYLLSLLSTPEDQAALGLWQDPLLQAACLEGARKAAAALQAAVGIGGSDGVEQGTVTCNYAYGMVSLLVGQQSAQPSPGSVAGAELVAAAWQCLLFVLQCTEQHGSEAFYPVQAARQLLGSAAARQVLFKQAGGGCTFEEVCSVLGRCLAVDRHSIAVSAVVGLLEEPGLWEAALAVPGFAAAVAAHAFRPKDNGCHVDGVLDKAPLLDALMSHESGRAALLAQHKGLGQVAGYAAASDEVSLRFSPHLAQLWGSGEEERLVGAMVAGLAGREAAWTYLFGWVVKERPAQEWCQLPGLVPALVGAFTAEPAKGMLLYSRVHDPLFASPPLQQVLVWLLESEQGQQLLSGCQELAEVVGGWLQRHVSPEQPSPVLRLLRASDPVAVGAMACLAASPVLFKGALLSLVTCRGGSDVLVADWLAQVQQLEQWVLGDRGLLCALLRALARCSAPPPRWCNPNTAVNIVLQRLPAESLLPQLLEVLAGEDQSSGNPQPTAAVTGEPDALLAHGAWLAVEHMQERGKPGKQLVLEAMQHLARDAGRVRALQQMEAAGHAAWVAAAEARQEVVGEQQQLQRDREALVLKQEQLQQEREALQAERQQLEQLRGEAGQERKRRQLS